MKPESEAATACRAAILQWERSGIAMLLCSICFILAGCGAGVQANVPMEFSLSCPGTVSTAPGSDVNATVTVNGSNGFSGNVNLAVAGLPAGVTAIFNPASTSSTSTLGVDVGSSVAPGTYSVTVTGTSGSLTSSTNIALAVAASGFSLSSSAGSLSIPQGSSATSTVTVVSIDGFSANVDLAASGLPSGVTATFSPASTSTISTVTFTAASSAAPGTYNALITGTSGSLTASTPSIAITVAQPVQTGPTTWYVRPDGGTRYDVNVPTGQCNGRYDAPYPGSGVNQNCAFNDVRYLWADGTPDGNWVISGGDTVIISNTYPSGEVGWRTGNLNGNAGGNLFDNYAGWPSMSGDGVMPPIPSGTSTNPTRILGANYASCSTTSNAPMPNWQVTDPTKTTQLFAGWGTNYVLQLSGSQHVEIQCLEITDHSDCIHFGSAGLPSVCSTSAQVTDAGQNGIQVNNKSGEITFQDVNIHGFSGQGIYGAIGGPFTLRRVRLAFNGFAGWNFDDGTANWPGAAITASYVTMEFNGCNEEYPIVDAIPAAYCYDTNNGGFGDGFSGQDAYLSSFTGDHLLLRYQTKDPFFGPHTAIGAISITNSIAYGNMGQTWKWNLGYNGTAVFRDNLTLNNCLRMDSPLPGAPSTYNEYLGGFCRADGAAMAFLWPVKGSLDISANTFVTMSTNVAIDFSCWDTINSISVAAGGTGYQVGDVLLIGGTGATATVTAVGANGAVTGVKLSSNGHTTATSAFTSSYIGGGHGSGVQITQSSVSPANCGGGPRILRNNIFLGINDQLNWPYSNGALALFCYSDCQALVGDTSDSMWTTREANVMWNYKAANGYCTYPSDICANPLFVNQPPLNVVNESNYDNFDFNPSSTSPAVLTGGVSIPGLTTDFYGNAWKNPPAIGAIQP